MRNSMYVICFLISTLLVAEAYAQTRRPSGGGGGGSRSSSGGGGGGGSRGSSYNPSRSSSGGSSSPSRSSSSSPSRSSSSGSSSSPSRGSSYNPSRSSSGSSSGSSSPSRGSSYNPSRSSSGSSSSSPSSSPSRSSGSSSSSSSSSGTSSPRGPSYDPTPSPSTGSTSAPSTSSSTTVPRGPSYDPTPGSNPTPTAPRGPNYNPSRTTDMRNPIPVRSVYAGRSYQHRPTVVSIPNLVVRYSRPIDYFRVVPRYHVYRWWVYEPVPYWYTDGYWEINSYPYYVYRGYRYRYSPVEICNYELVDSTNNAVVKVFADKFCTVAYDECAIERDAANIPEQYERFFCAERVADDLANSDDTVFNPRPVDVSSNQSTTIANYLASHSYRDIYRDVYQGVVGNCSIIRLWGNEDGCKYIVSINDKFYPDVEGSICSDDQAAARMGCNIGNEKENLGCILARAIQDGYCSVP